MVPDSPLLECQRRGRRDRRQSTVSVQRQGLKLDMEDISHLKGPWGKPNLKSWEVASQP